MATPKDTRTGRPAVRRSVRVQGYALRVIRERSGKTATQLAEALGVSATYVSHIETGGKQSISPEMYSRILAALDIDERRALMADPPPRTPAASAGQAVA